MEKKFEIINENGKGKEYNDNNKIISEVFGVEVLDIYI